MQWAADEGWNPGSCDAGLFWNTDPEGFLGVESDGRLVGAGAIIDYGRAFGFMGLFIVTPELRGRGVGRRLWYHRRDTLLARLQPGAAIALDGVKDMEGFYAGGGFRATHDEVRMSTRAPRAVGGGAEPVTEVDESIAALDVACFGAARPAFLGPWLTAPGHISRAVRHDGRIVGFGTLRPCQSGFKVGPLFAESADVADTIFRSLCADLPESAEVFVDVPEVNREAMKWIATRGGNGGLPVRPDVLRIPARHRLGQGFRHHHLGTGLISRRRL